MLRWSTLLSRCDERFKELERLHEDWLSFNADYNALQAWISEQSLILKGMDVQASRVSLICIVEGRGVKRPRKWYQIETVAPPSL